MMQYWIWIMQNIGEFTATLETKSLLKIIIMTIIIVIIIPPILYGLFKIIKKLSTWIENIGNLISTLILELIKPNKLPLVKILVLMISVSIFTSGAVKIIHAFNGNEQNIESYPKEETINDSDEKISLPITQTNYLKHLIDSELIYLFSSSTKQKITNNLSVKKTIIQSIPINLQLFLIFLIVITIFTTIIRNPLPTIRRFSFNKINSCSSNRAWSQHN